MGVQSIHTEQANFKLTISIYHHGFYSFRRNLGPIEDHIGYEVVYYAAPFLDSRTLKEVWSQPNIKGSKQSFQIYQNLVPIFNLHQHFLKGSFQPTRRV